MKKLIVIGIVAMMVMGLAGAASAAAFVPDDIWRVQLRAENGGIAQASVNMGTKVGTGDGYVQTDGDLGLTGAVSGAGEISITTLGVLAGITPDGRWGADYRAPFADFGQTKVWDLKASINGAASGTITLKGWVLASATIASPDIFVALFDGVVTASNFQAAIPLWKPLISTSGTSALPQYSASVNIDGSKQYTLVAWTNPVPEPGSMVALFSGLIGLVGFGIRRRK